MEQNVIQKSEDSMKLNFEGLKMQKRSIPTDRAQRVDKKNGVTFLAMLIPWVMVIKISKNTFFVLCGDDSKKSSHNFDKIFKWTWKILLRSF